MTLRPGEAPLFARGDTAVPDTYPGHVETPTFDEELAVVGDPETADQRLGTRARAVARLHAHGVPASIIAKRLKYSPQAVAGLLMQPKVQSEVRRYRETWELDPNQRIKDASIDGVDRLHAIVLDPDANPKLVIDASKFLIEKATGKARQEVDLNVGGLLQYMEIMKTMVDRGETLEPVDVTPSNDQNLLPESQVSAQPADRWGDWLDTNS